MTFNQDDEFDFPSARKGTSGGPQGGFANQDDPWSAPVPPMHTPDFTFGFDQPSTPYGPPISGAAPPPPRAPARTTTSGNGRNRGSLLIALALIFALLIGSLAFFLLRGTNSTTPTGLGPVALATSTLVPTATLLPGQTPFPTHVPTATPQPTAPPGLPTFTPVPTATSIPYASNATVTFTTASRRVDSTKPTLTAQLSGGDIAASQLGSPVSVAVGDTKTAGIDAPETDFGSQVFFNINVTNNTTAKQIVPQGVTVTSSTKNSGGVFVTCSTQNSGATVSPLAIGATTTQTCYEPVESEPPASYNVTVNGWLYVGSSAMGGNQPIWTVPSTCAADNLSAAETKAQAGLLSKLQAATPGGTTVFDRNQYFYNSGAATCSPAANAQQNSPFQYTVSVAGTANETYFSNGAVTTFEQGQLSTAFAALGGGWQLSTTSGNTKICPSGATLSGASSSGVTISCPSSEVANWTWTGAAESTISAQIASQPSSAALAYVKAVPNLQGGTVKIALNGGSYLPRNAGSIAYTVVYP